MDVYSFQPGHQDLVHDIAYDYYGKRIATCSSDQKVKVWDKEEVFDSDGKSSQGFRWVLNDSWKVEWDIDVLLMEFMT